MAFDAEDAPILQLQDLANISVETWGSLCFTFHPSMQLLDLQWNVIPVWQALDVALTPPAIAKINAPCILWRSELNVHYRSIELQEYNAIRQLNSGASFADLCEMLHQDVADLASEQAAQYLSSWLDAGMISNLTA